MKHDAGYWMLDTRCLKADTRYSMLDARPGYFRDQHQVTSIQYLDFIMGATGFDRDVRVKEACRVTAYPYPSGTKHNCRLSRVRTSRLARLHHPDFLSALSPEWCHTSRIVSLNACTGRRELTGWDDGKPVSGCSVIRDKCTD